MRQFIFSVGPDTCKVLWGSDYEKIKANTQNYMAGIYLFSFPTLSQFNHVLPYGFKSTHVLWFTNIMVHYSLVDDSMVTANTIILGGLGVFPMP